jgi:DNA-binding NtrC family response regulator
MTRPTHAGILIVEPASQERADLIANFVARGWRVWHAADGPSAIQVCHAHADEIQVALVDLQLPGLEGSRVLAELNHVNPNLFRCAMTSAVSAYTAAAFRRLTSTPLFTKPIAVEQFDQVVRQQLTVSA